MCAIGLRVSLLLSPFRCTTNLIYRRMRSSSVPSTSRYHYHLFHYLFAQHSMTSHRGHNRNQSRHCLCVMSVYACVYSTQLIRLFLSPFCSTAHLISRVNVYYTYTIHNYNSPLNLLNSIQYTCKSSKV